MTTKDLHLWEIDHPYYASDGCYYLPGNRWDEAHSEWESWADFHEAWGDSDKDYNLLYRWDWERADPDDYDEADAPGDKLRLFYMLQRKAKPHSHCINVAEADEPAIRAWLTEHAEHLRMVWEPLLDGAAAVERARSLHARDGEGFCVACDYMTPHPCPTLRALDGTEDPTT